MTDKVDSSKVRYGILAVIAGMAVAWIGQPLIQDNDQAVNVIVTVFSVLAGFLVAIIAIIGDPVLLPPGTWRAAEMERSKLQKRLVRHKWLFTLYLLTLGLIFLALLLKEQDPRLIVWLERGFLFLGMVSFVLSLRLPGALMGVQSERIDAVIEHRRRQDGIGDSNDG